MKNIIRTIISILAVISLTACIEEEKKPTYPSYPSTPEDTYKKILPRKSPTPEVRVSVENFLTHIDQEKLNLESIMLVQDGNVVYEEWRGKGKPDLPHVMWSVSKTFTSMAVGYAVMEGKLSLEDQVISFFPELLPEKVSENLSKMKVKHLLTMMCGARKESSLEGNWAKNFLAMPIVDEPGTVFRYNTQNSYMLSAIIQKITGKKVIDYLDEKLFTPLGIERPEWMESPQGITHGGFGLKLKTEDMAIFGLALLNEGKYQGKQIIPAEWIREASKKQVKSVPEKTENPNDFEIPENDLKNSWSWGYGYHIWRCPYNSYRADGSFGQFIIVVPEKNTVIAITSQERSMDKELNAIWKYLYPGL